MAARILFIEGTVTEVAEALRQSLPSLLDPTVAAVATAPAPTQKKTTSSDEPSSPSSELTQRSASRQLLESILRSENRPLRSKDLQRFSKLSQVTVDKHLKQMMYDGMVSRTPERTYVLANSTPSTNAKS